MKRTFLLLTLFFCYTTLFAQVRLPKIFGDHMVLQRDQPITVWGWSSPRERITVQLDKHSKRVTAGKDGKWKVALDAMPAGGPFQLVVKGKNTITFSDVLIGEVWICSGQSNMEWRVINSNDAEKEIAAANYPLIRHIKVPKTIAGEPADDIGDTSWQLCNPDNVPGFTAVGYFFARELANEINVPVGLINTSWGGTHVETWTSKEAFQKSEEFRPMIAAVGKINIDSARQHNVEAIMKRIQALQGASSDWAKGAEQWKEPSFDDAGWRTLNVPGSWERSGIGNVDGVVWFRRSFTMPSDAAGHEGVLNLGRIDDADETYVNGVRVGGTSDREANRSYRIAAGTLREGENVIAVKIQDTGGAGGFIGQASDLQLFANGKNISLAGEWSYHVESISRTNGDVSPNAFPTLLYNAMIHPLIPYTIRGALWYQGESNASRAYQYRQAFPLMINDWRGRWGLGDFPFYFVQLATYNAANGNSDSGSAWAELREAQTLTLKLPNTGMAVTTDIGDPADIHPRNKQDVGRRLAALALHDVYARPVVARGPVYKSIKKEGSTMVVSFTDVGSGLLVKDKYGYLKGFEIAGADKKSYYAQARVDGNKVIVSHQDVTEPVAVRYGWADDASDCNLYNKEGFPAGPFRTDDWKGVTEEAKFNVVRIVQ